MSAEWDREEVVPGDEIRKLWRPAQPRPVMPEEVAASSSGEEVFAA